MFSKCIEIPWGDNNYFKLSCPDDILNVFQAMFPQAESTNSNKHDALLYKKNNLWYFEIRDANSNLLIKLSEDYLLYKVAIFIEEAIESKVNNLVLHGGAFCKNNNAILICQQRRSGKTVLLTDILSEDDVEYISDDILFINKNTISGVGMPLRLREKYIKDIRMSGRIIGSTPDPDGGERFFYVPSCSYHKGISNLSSIIIPNYIKDTDNTFQELKGNEKIGSLIQNVRKPNDMKFIYKSLTELSKNIPIYRLKYNNIAYAREKIGLLC